MRQVMKWMTSMNKFGEIDKKFQKKEWKKGHAGTLLDSFIV